MIYDCECPKCGTQFQTITSEAYPDNAVKVVHDNAFWLRTFVAHLASGDWGTQYDAGEIVNFALKLIAEIRNVEGGK